MIVFVAFALVIIAATCVLLSLRALGTVWPWERMVLPIQASRYHHIRFEVDERTNGKTQRALALLERHGYVVACECQAGWDRTTTITMRKEVR